MFPPHFSFFRSFTQDDTLPAWLLFAVCTLVGSHLGTWGILSTAGCLVGDLSLVQHCPVSRQPPTEQAVSSFMTSFFPEPKTWKAVSTSWDVFQLLAKSYLTLCNPMVCSTPVFLVLHYLPEFAQTHVHWVSDAIQPSHSLSPLLWPSIFPSIRVFSSELALHIRWPKCWSFSTNFPKTHSPFCNCLSLSGALRSLNVILKFSVSGCISVWGLQASKALSRNSEGSSSGFYFPFVFYRVSLFGVPVS